MPVLDVPRFVTAIGDGSNTEWPFTFKVMNDTEIFVILREVATGVEILVDAADYAVALNNDLLGGTVMYPLSGSPVAGTYSVVVYSDTARTQLSNISNQNSFYPETVMDMVDKLTILAQENHAAGKRSVKSPVGVTAPTLLVGPEGSVPMVDAEGNLTQHITGAAINSAEANAAAAALDAARAEAAAASVSLEVADYTALIALTSGDLVIGEYVRMSGTNHIYQRVASGGIISGSGITLNPRPFAFSAYDASCMGLTLDGATDDSVKVNALAQWMSANGGGALFLPAGKMSFHSVVTATLSGDDTALSIVGAGKGVSRIYTPVGNTTGAIKLILSRSKQQQHVSGVSVYSMIPKATASDSGVGIYLTSTIGTDGTTDAVGWGDRRLVQATVHNCEVIPAVQGITGQWATPIKVEYMWRPEVTNCTVATEHNSSKTDAVLVWQAGAGVEFRQCYWPVLRYTQVFGRWDFGVHIHGIRDVGDSDFEEFTVEHCEIVGFPEHGLRVSHDNVGQADNIRKEPGGLIANNHIHAQNRRIWITDHRNFRIINNNPAMALPAAHTVVQNETGIYLERCTDFTISGNEFWEDGYYVSDSDATRMIWLDDECDHGTIIGNGFGVNGVGVYHECAESGILIEANRWTSQIGGAVLVANRPTKKIVVAGTGEPVVDGWVPFTFTPELRFGGATTGITYGSRSGILYRRGNEVRGHLEITLTSKGTATGACVIALAGVSPSWSVFDIADTGFGQFNVNYLAAANFPSETIPIASMAGSLIALRDTSTNLTDQATDADFGNTTSIRISFSYIAVQD